MSPRRSRSGRPQLVGIDPGLAQLGYAVVALDPEPRLLVLGVVTTKKATRKGRSVRVVEDNVRRVRQIGDQIDRLFDSVDAVAIEAFSHPPSATTAAQVSMAIGAVVEKARARELAILQATPQEIKEAVCGRKTATKLQVEAALSERFGEMLVADLLEGVAEGKHEHAFDALGAVVACLDTDEVRLLRR